MCRMCKCIKVLEYSALLLFLGIAEGGTWSRTGDLNIGRSGFSAAVFTNGKVMAVGGLGESGGCEIFDLATGTWAWNSLPGSMSHGMAMLLPNGKVLAVLSGGDIWLYDPHSDSWDQSAASFGGWDSRHCATLLKNGKMLAIGYKGWTNPCCALYDWASDSVTPTSDVSIDHGQGVEVMLPSGKVLIAGGSSSGTTCEIYDLDTGAWNLTNFPMNEGRSQFVGILLRPPWQNVLVAGGGFSGGSCELYDPASGIWSYTGPLNFNDRSTPAMALLPSGEVLMVGATATCELYNPATKTWSTTDVMETKRSHHSAAVLPTGKILAIGTHTAVGDPYLCEIYDPSDGVWATKPSLNHERAAHTVTPLPIIHTTNCSTNVLIAGGENSSGILKSCELYNYSLDSVSVTGELNEARTHHTATLLADGRVLVAGGKDGATARASSELYYMVTEVWVPIAGNMTDARFDHTATLLKDGRVLVTGGEDAGTYLSSCETYDGANWTPTANVMTTPRARHTAIILLNGNILVIGGQTTGGAATATCELWNGATWTNKASMNTARYWHTATLLQSGKVLVAGGTSDGTSGLSSCEIFDPDSNKWFPEDNLNTARYLHNTTILYSGLVLVTGGNAGITSCEIWDPAAGWDTDTLTNTHQWKVTATLGDGRAYHSSVLIPDTMPFILAIGGKSGASYLNSIEEYDVGLGYRSIWQSTITNYPAVTTITDSMPIEGTDFRGFSEADGGNHCHIASNDHPIISLVRVGGGNWQGNGGGEILHMPLSSYWDTANTTVHPDIADFQGYYRLWSIVNGIPCKWYEPCPPSGAEEKTDRRHKATGISVSVYPNPSTIGVRFQVSGAKLSSYQAIKLSIYDLSGRLVRSLLITDNQTPNTEITWDRRDLKSRKVKSGIYFYRLNCKDFEIKGKFVILK